MNIMNALRNLSPYLSHKVTVKLESSAVEVSPRVIILASRMSQRHILPKVEAAAGDDAYGGDDEWLQLSFINIKLSCRYIVY